MHAIFRFLTYLFSSKSTQVPEETASGQSTQTGTILLSRCVIVIPATLPQIARQVRVLTPWLDMRGPRSNEALCTAAMCPKADDPVSINQFYRTIEVEVGSEDNVMTGTFGLTFVGYTTSFRWAVDCSRIRAGQAHRNNWAVRTQVHGTRAVAKTQ